MHFDLMEILPTIGYIGIFAIVFAESGLLIGFFLPGDSLLFTAGFLASQGIFDIHIFAVICFLAAVLGDSVGYAFGQRVGKRLFYKTDSWFFHRDNLEKANSFYKKHGRKTIILARFMPIIRTFAPIVAGIGDMEYRTFIVFNLIGGILWAMGLSYAGYFLGNLIPNVDKYLIPIVLGIIILSVAPGIYHVLKDPETRKNILATLRRK